MRKRVVSIAALVLTLLACNPKRTEVSELEKHTETIEYSANSITEKEDFNAKYQESNFDREHRAHFPENILKAIVSHKYGKKPGEVGYDYWRFQVKKELFEIRQQHGATHFAAAAFYLYGEEGIEVRENGYWAVSRKKFPEFRKNILGH